jgi:CDP-diacylglycerol--glycerol-3-phosphate 3-phosphatidyltransferase
MSMKARGVSNTQKYIDNVIDRLFLRYIPRSITPNQVTLIRFLLIPVVSLLLIIGKFDLALLVFIFAASTDFIDGAMARTRNQITDTGKVIDPIADKLLIMSVLLFTDSNYFIVKVLIVFISIEIIAVILGVLLSHAVGKPIGANVFGKIKLILQSFGVGFFMLGLFMNDILLIRISGYVLALALVFAVLSGLETGRRKLLQIKNDKVLYPKT